MKHESQVGELNRLKLKAVVLHDDRDEDIHMTQSVGFQLMCFSFLKLVWMNYVWFDLLSRGYVGSRNGAACLLSLN